MLTCHEALSGIGPGEESGDIFNEGEDYSVAFDFYFLAADEPAWLEDVANVLFLLCWVPFVC